MATPEVAFTVMHIRHLDRPRLLPRRPVLLVGMVLLEVEEMAVEGMAVAMVEAMVEATVEVTEEEIDAIAFYLGRNPSSETPYCYL